MIVIFSREYYAWLLSDVRRDLWRLDDNPDAYTHSRRAALRRELTEDARRLAQRMHAAPLSAEFDGMQ